MKITKRQLRQLIAEEVQGVLVEADDQADLLKNAIADATLGDINYFDNAVRTWLKKRMDRAIEDFLRGGAGTGRGGRLKMPAYGRALEIYKSKKDEAGYPDEPGYRERALTAAAAELEEELEQFVARLGVNN